MQLRTAQKCVKRVRSTKYRIIRPLFNPQITKFYTVIRADIGYSHNGYGTTSYFQSAVVEVRNTAENAASDGFESNFSGVAFCMAQPIGGLLLLGIVVLNETLFS